QPRELLRVIGELAAKPPPPPRPGVEALIDKEEALAGVAGDFDILRSLVTVFLETSPGQLAELRQAIARRDSSAVKRAAHTLKGTVGHFSKGPAFQAAQRLETMGHEGKLAGVEPVADALEQA